ncbi:DUF952 domain-containing protein [Halorarius halobius]|uniref:DUF952 domain-containing protein n=1 Tax=Halorarius halobius TaxID=2962671 RepID=UPI0020CBB254|nr:DUF952 domain-containing protein [Halorarius halobius]
MDAICHVVARGEWDPDADEYRHETLDSQGFIHFSDPEQVVPVAESNHAGEENLVILVVDADAVDAEVVYEALGDASEPYPHVYGPLNTDAVVEAVPFPPDPDGGFSLPERVRTLAER